MDPHFWPAWGAIREGDIGKLRQLLGESPDLARARSGRGHPTLMQALVLDGVALEAETQRAMAQALIEHGSPVNEPFVSAGSLGNTVLAEVLVAAGAPLDGDPGIMGGWSALEEALYWQQSHTALRLLELGARVRNLRIAAGVGDRAAVPGFFRKGRPENAGNTNFPFCENDPDQVTENPQDVVNNALIYAAGGGHTGIVEDLLAFGAQINALPPGFHVPGSALHYAAMHGREAVCELLLIRGADPALADGSEDKRPPAAWASYGEHETLAARLTRAAAEP